MKIEDWKTNVFNLIKHLENIFYYLKTIII